MSILAVVERGDASYEAVLRAAGRLAGPEPFEVLSVFPAPLSWYREVALESPAEQTEVKRDGLKQAIEADLAARSLQATVTIPVARRANVGDDIVERAEEAGISVIVIGTHGRTGLGRLFMGSVAERVVRHAHCDVYVSRPPQAD